jgi:hypothetical protein
MDQVAAQALTLYAKIAGINRAEASSSSASTRFSLEMPCSILMQDLE